jgi:hypothetical protein
MRMKYIIPFEGLKVMMTVKEYGITRTIHGFLFIRNNIIIMTSERKIPNESINTYKSRQILNITKYVE